MCALTAGLVAYSQTFAFAYDEGFHLLAAQLIGTGKRPYVDFFFPQTPLNAYWNALWMWVFGGGWRVSHAVAALLTGAATMLTADFVYFRCPAPQWRVTVALTAAFAVATNALAMEFGTIAQAYGICTFLIVAAYRCAIAAPASMLGAAAAGLLSVAAAGCTLLGAPAAPVLALWIVLSRETVNRWGKLVAFCLGAGVALTPIAWLYSLSPANAAFNVVGYHLRYREVQWSGALQHNLEVLTAWILSPQSLVLGLLAASGIWFARYRSGWNRTRRSEFYLCGWLILALAMHVSRASPTFERYYILCVPFLAMLGAMGLYSIGTRLSAMRTLAAIAILITSLGLARRLWDSQEDTSWKRYEEIAAKVEEVTPAGAALFAEEAVHFLLRRAPMSGLEHADARKLDNAISPEFAARLHVIPQSAVDAMMRNGEFATIETCKDETKIAELGLTDLYAQKTEIGDCAIFWDLKPKGKVKDE